MQERDRQQRQESRGRQVSENRQGCPDGADGQRCPQGMCRVGDAPGNGGGNQPYGCPGSKQQPDLFGGTPRASTKVGRKGDAAPKAE